MMSQFEFVSCRLAIQICIGRFPDGRERHRTFSLKNIRPDADGGALTALVRAVESLLAYPVTRARLIVKKRRVLFGAESSPDREEDAALETPRVAPACGTSASVAAARMGNVFAEAVKTIADARSFFKTFFGVCPKYRYQLGKHGMILGHT
jgi:hypothetical protein